VADPREVRLEDANGDGLDDLVHVTGSRVRIWLNRGDATFAPARDITGIPLMRAGNTGVVAVRFMDIDGSGTRDLVFGEPGRGYTAIDLDGGKRPGLLREVRTGLGKSTELFYTTSTAEALAAEAEGKPWTSRMPLVTHLVSRTVDHDNLEKIGRPAGTYETKYRYYDPHYEPRHRDFQGFERVVSRDVGDATIASAVSETSFLYPACVDDDPQPGVPSPCDDAGYYRDQPGRYLVGKPSRVDVRADDGTPYSTTFSRYLPQILYRGIDGRVVRWAYTDETSTVLYDPANPDRAPYSYSYYPITPGSAAAPGVLSDSKPGNFLASAGFVMTAKATTLSLFGEPIVSYDYGCALACAQAEDLISAYSESSPVAATSSPASTQVRGTTSG
jgi:hypothetical protein